MTTNGLVSDPVAWQIVTLSGCSLRPLTEIVMFTNGLVSDAVAWQSVTLPACPLPPALPLLSAPLLAPPPFPSSAGVDVPFSSPTVEVLPSSGGTVEVSSSSPDPPDGLACADPVIPGGPPCGLLAELPGGLVGLCDGELAGLPPGAVPVKPGGPPCGFCPEFPGVELGGPCPLPFPGSARDNAGAVMTPTQTTSARTSLLLTIASSKRFR